jgi:hypothetical protein
MSGNRTSFAPDTTSPKLTNAIELKRKCSKINDPALTTVWLQVRVQPRPPRFAVTGYSAQPCGDRQAEACPA